MEFERSLFRVYERVVEDLVQTRALQLDAIPTNNSDQADEESNQFPDREHLNNRGTSSPPSHATVPFIWPLWRFQNASANRPTRQDNQSRIWNILRMRSHRSRTSSLSERSVDDSSFDVGNDHRIDVEMTSLAPGTSQSLNLGLRRRNNSNSSSSRDGSESSNSNSTLSGVQGNQDVHIHVESSPTPATRLAQTIASRQRQRDDEQDTESGGISQKGIFLFMRLCMIFALFHSFVLYCLHTTYVGPRNIAKYDPTSNNAIGHKTATFRTCLEYALQTRSEEERLIFDDKFGERGDDEDKENDQSESNSNTWTAQVKDKANTTSVPLLGRNEILQIKIVYGDHCSEISGQCSRVHKVVIPNITATTNKTETASTHANIATTSDAGAEFSSVDKYSAAEYWEKPAYKFATTQSLLFLDRKMLFWHNISIVNVTLSERCLSTGKDDGIYSSWLSHAAQFLSTIYGIDALLINQLMFSIKTSQGKYRHGYVLNVESEERWSYSSAQLDVYYSFSQNVAALVMSGISFFLVTSVTAMIVRLLATSGVMIVFPIISGLRAFGVITIDERILDFSYPWVGSARRAINQQNVHSFTHFLSAHIAKLLLVYVMYESCQTAWTGFLYNKSTPANLTLWIFGNVMVFEYFSMLFVRCSLRYVPLGEMLSKFDPKLNYQLYPKPALFVISSFHCSAFISFHV